MDTISSNQFSWGKWFLMGAVSMALCSLLPFSLFAAVPLAFAILLYGKTKAFGLGVLCLSFLIALIIGAKLPPMVGFIFFAAFVFANVSSEIILKQFHPGKGLIGAGLALVLIIIGLLGLFASMSKMPIKAQLEKEVVTSFEKIKTENKELFKKGGEEARNIELLMSDPKKLATDILNWAPAGIFVMTIIGLWVTLFMLLRNSLVWRKNVKYPYSVRDLVHFRVPAFFVWPLIVALAFAVGGEYILGPTGTVIGISLLYCLGIFYFFQGTGVFLDLLSYMRIFGLFRTFIMVMTIFMAWRILIVVGIFDNWLDFRKFLKKNDKGEL